MCEKEQAPSGSHLGLTHWLITVPLRERLPSAGDRGNHPLTRHAVAGGLFLREKTSRFVWSLGCYPLDVCLHGCQWYY